MGRLLLICRLAMRDLRRRPTEAVLLVLVIAAATTTLTLGLALGGATDQPYQQTRDATAGPDVVADLSPPVPGQAGPALSVQVAALTAAPGVVGHSGPYPVVAAVLRAGGHTVPVEAQGRGTAPAAVDQPALTSGAWVRSGGVVIERTFAEALGVRTGDRVTLDGRAFRVAGIAVSAANPPYPNTCYLDCPVRLPRGAGLTGRDTGLVWLTELDARALATPANPLAYVVNLKLRDPAAAPAFADRYGGDPADPAAPLLFGWQAVRDADGLLVADQRQVLLPAAWLLGLLAVASVAVLAGSRMADETRRVGPLKAVGGSPGTVAAVLLAEHLAQAVVAAAAGLAAGRLAAPLLTGPGAGLLGTAAPPPVDAGAAAIVVGLAVAVVLAATAIPAARAARTSTADALAGTTRPVHRRSRLTAVSAHLPVPLLLGARLAARRPRRIALNAASVAVVAAGIMAVLIYHATAGHAFGSTGLPNPLTDRVGRVMAVFTVVAVILAATNSIFVAWATVLDSVRPAAVSRALGVPPDQVVAGLCAAQAVPALLGAIAGVPAGIGLFTLANGGGAMVLPPASWLVAMAAGTLLVVVALTAVPARIGAHRPVAEILRAEAA